MWVNFHISPTREEKKPGTFAVTFFALGINQRGVQMTGIDNVGRSVGWLIGFAGDRGRLKPT